MNHVEQKRIGGGSGTVFKTNNGKNNHQQKHQEPQQLLTQAKSQSTGITIVKQSTGVPTPHHHQQQQQHSVSHKQLPIAKDRNSLVQKTGVKMRSSVNDQLAEQESPNYHEQTTSTANTTTPEAHRQLTSPSQIAYQRENYPRVMQREKRQNKYVPKRQQNYQSGIDHDSQQATMQYQPLRRPQNVQNGPQNNKNDTIQQQSQQDQMMMHQQQVPPAMYQQQHRQHQGHNQNDGFNGHGRPQLANQRRKHIHYHGQNAPRSNNDSFMNQVMVNSDEKSARFQNHPVHAYKAGQVAYVAKHGGNFQQLQSHAQSSSGQKKNVSGIKNNHNRHNNNANANGGGFPDQFRQQQKQQSSNYHMYPNQSQAQQQQQQHFLNIQHPQPTQEPIPHILRFNSAAAQASAMAQGHHPSQHGSARGDCRQPHMQQSYGGSGMKASPVSEAQHGPTAGYASGTGFVPNNPLQLIHGNQYNTPMFYPPQNGFPMRNEQGLHQGIGAAPLQMIQGQQQMIWPAQTSTVTQEVLLGPQMTQLPQQQPMMQVVSTPLRMKTTTPIGQGTQDKPIVTKKISSSPIANTNKIQQQNSKTQEHLESDNKKKEKSNSKASAAQMGKKSKRKPGTKPQPEKQPSFEEEKTTEAEGEHRETFQCLSTCTEWYLIAQVGNSQVKIPAKNQAVRFSENAEELPILTKDQDLIECLVRLEEHMSSTEKQSTQLNRPVAAGNNPSSSNNISNNGYRKKDHVKAAQQDYESKLKLNLIGDQEQVQQKRFPLHLPIQNGSHDANTRIIDIYMHHRTQQLMCLEFDLTHLKLDDAESSFSGEYTDNFSMTPSAGEGGDSAQPTPFMGVPKSRGPYAYGQPQHVLYINQGNDVARKLRCINQEYVEETTYFKLNGECHGKLVFEQDLKYQIQGKKVIKSIQERLIRAKDYIFSEIVRLEPGITHRRPSKSSSNSKSREPSDRQVPKTHQRSQKSILSTLRNRNKHHKGPYLRRPDQIHIPVVNVTKSLGFKMLMPNLASIDNMLTNFNQIVMQEGLIQSFLFSFDLPVHQLSTATPAVSNSLVVKVPRDMMAQAAATAGNSQMQGNIQYTQQHQAAYLAYQQHQAAMTLGCLQDQGQQPYFHPAPHQPDMKKETQDDASKANSNQLWDLVDEFKKISQGPPSTASNMELATATPQPTTNKPAGYTNGGGHPGSFSSPFSQHIASSSNSNGSSTFQQPPFLSQISSLVSNSQQQHLHQPPFYGSSRVSCGVSSQNSNLSFHQQPAFGGLYASPQMQQERQSRIISNHQPQMMLGQQHTNLVPQQIHQALYSLGRQFNPQFGYNGGSEGAAGDFYSLEGQEGPAYVPPEDPNYLSNLDRLLEAITPRVPLHQLESTSIKDFFKAFRQTSVFGLRVELLNEQTLQPELFTFTPTLSSLVLSYSKPVDGGEADRVNRILDFDGVDDNKTAVPEKDPETVAADCEGSELFASEAAGPHEPARRESSTSSVITQLAKPHMKFIEHHETEPHYSRPAFFSKIKEIISDVPHLKQVLLKPATFNFGASWFSMLWTCQRVCTVPAPADDSNQLELAFQSNSGGADNAKMSSSAVTNIQFLAIFRFRPDPATVSNCPQQETDKRVQRPITRSLPVQLIGLMPYKLERESFWGEMYDQICEDNIILLQDLKQRAIEFLQPQASREEMHDFTHLLNSTNSSIFDFF